jgi:hypothetical protein
MVMKDIHDRSTSLILSGKNCRLEKVLPSGADAEQRPRPLQSTRSSVKRIPS